MEYWNHTDFQLKAHTNRDVAVIIGADDIISALEESQVTLGNIRGSRFVTPIKVTCLLWVWSIKVDMVYGDMVFSWRFERQPFVGANWRIVGKSVFK